MLWLGDWLSKAVAAVLERPAVPTGLLLQVGDGLMLCSSMFGLEGQWFVLCLCLMSSLCVGKGWLEGCCKRCCGYFSDDCFFVQPTCLLGAGQQ
jgi:hypothetical protein